MAFFVPGAGRNTYLDADLPAEPETEDDARLVLEAIQSSKGYLSKSTLSYLEKAPPQTAKEIHRGFEALRLEAAAFTKSIATQLNSSDFHFIYELLQNADDANYEIARGSGNKPSIKFSVSPGKIIVDTNEDGFLRTNVEAVCSTGRSSKKTSAKDKHIGEKGFGFKSIFVVAKKVQIRSRVWSFHFDHDEEDSGLGMVTPIIDDLFSLPAGVQTRITLTLNAKHREKYARLAEEFENLTDTTFFFLQQLSEVTVSVQKGDGSQSSVTYIKATGAGRARLVKRIGPEGSTDQKNEERFFEVYESTVQNMPLDERRPGRTSAPIVLAFPTDRAGQTAVIDSRGQHYFAYLPIGRMVQLQFLIQSDFITSASRESTIDCEWNDRLLDGIASTFCDAIQSFCNSKKLVYEWARFVPRLPMQGYWKLLEGQIIEGLSKRAVLETWQSRLLRCPKQLRSLPEDTLHNGKPLFADIYPEIYLAPEYPKESSELLRIIGVRKISWDKILDRIESDVNSPNSRLKNTSSSDTWHDTVAKLLQQIFENPDLQDYRPRVRALSIIPLVGGKWKTNYSLFSSITYFPIYEGVCVPTDLGLDIVTADATKSSVRKQLFRNLGVRDCGVELVVTNICRIHKFSQPQSLSNAITHFRYLYWVCTGWPVQCNPALWAYTDSDTFKKAIDGLYFKSVLEYSTAQLLKTTANDTMAAPIRSNAFFLHDEYLKPELTDRPGAKLTWRMWLEQVVGIRYYPPLMDCSLEKDLSPILKHVLSISSQRFLHTLKAHWVPEYQLTFDSSKFAETVLKKSMVLCKDGSCQELQLTYLPTSEILARQDELALSKGLQILDLGDELIPIRTSDWEFLRKCGVKGELDVSFHFMALLACKMYSGTDRVYLTSTTRKIYQWIGSNAKQNQAKWIQENFNSESLVYVPSQPEGRKWKGINDCVWDAPKFLTVKTGLADQFDDNTESYALFKNILSVRDANFLDFLEELRERKTTPGTDIAETAFKIYETLYVTVNDPAGWDLVRSQFENDHLVYAKGSWYPPSSCLWSCPVIIDGKPILSNLYKDLRSFFVVKLKVKKAEVGMLVQDLTKKLKAKTPPTAIEVKCLLLKIAEMLRGEPADPVADEHFEALKQVPFLPVRVGIGDTYLASIHSDFAVLDHCQYAEAFGGSARILDFSQIEALQLYPLLRRLGLDTRGLSHLVQEKSIAGASSSMEEVLTKDFRDRAYAFYCCALKYRSLKTIDKGTELFKQLSSVELYTSDDMCTTLVLRQDGHEITATSHRSQILVEEIEQTYRIYVPRRASERRSCYRSKMPEHMLHILGIFDKSALHSASRVLNEYLTDLDDVMLELNIPPASWLVRPPVASPSPVQSEDDKPDSESRFVSVLEAGSMGSGTTGSTPPRPVEVIPRTLSWQSVSAGTPFTLSTERSGGILPFEDEVSEYSSQRTTPPEFTFTSLPVPQSASPRYTRRPSSGIANRYSIRSSEGPSYYSRLLSQVIELASRATNDPLAAIQSSGSVFDFTAILAAVPQVDSLLPPSLDLESIFGLRGMARDFKIGAAGELYVFERLKKLGLLNFTRGNWCSRIRKEVTIHPSYADMPSYDLLETADIVYADTNGDLTRFLQSSCYGDFPDFPGLEDIGKESTPPITYYLEVKSTTSGNPDEKFYMSKNEYDLMHSCALQPNQTPTKIYVILRVYNLTSNEIDMKLFVDPCRFERSGTLKFQTGVYHVYPTTSRM